MRAFVCIKQVPDTLTRMKIVDNTNVDQTNTKWIINPYDDFAIEEAIRFKEKGLCSQVTAISIGPKSRIADALRTALAMGADDALAVDSEPLDALQTAQVLSALIKQQGAFSFVFLGTQTIDQNSSCVSQMLAHYLNVQHVWGVSKISQEGEQFCIERNIENGAKEIFLTKPPFVIAATKGLNTPRLTSLPNIMKAKKKPLQEIPVSSFSLSDSQAKITQLLTPPERAPVQILAGDLSTQTSKLVDLLRNEAKILS